MFLDTIVRYGQLFQAEKAQQQNSLFGGMDAVDVVHPIAPKAEKWPVIEKLNKERELLESICQPTHSMNTVLY